MVLVNARGSTSRDELLKKLASERGRSVPDLIKELIDTYIGGNISPNTQPSAPRAH
jgi:predicted DNA-binding protein